MPPSLNAGVPALRAAVELLLGQSRVEFDLGQLQQAVLEVTPLVGRLEGWLRTTESELWARGDGRLTADDGSVRSVAGWLADVRRETPAAAGGRVRTSRLLREHLPLVAEAVLDGVLTVAQAQVLTRLVGRIDGEALLQSQYALIAVAAPLDPAQLGAWVADKIATHCEPALDDDERTGQARRFLQTSREDDGALRGRFVLSREDSEAFLTALEPLARRQDLSDTRTAGQRRADALVEVCEQVLRAGDLGDAGGLRPQLSYVLPAGWAADQVGRATCQECGPRCAEHAPVSFSDDVQADLPQPLDDAEPGPVGARARRASSGQAGLTAGVRPSCATAAWSGPQTRTRIEAVLCDARISRVLLDPVGQVRGLESATDSVTPNQRRALAARDRGCVARGCTRPPAMCDAHHLVGRADGGPTCLDNLVLVCRRHHVLWHRGRLRHRDLRIAWHDTQRPPAHESPPRATPRAPDDLLTPTA